MCAYVLTCTCMFLPRAHVYVHRSLLIFLVIYYSVMSLNFKFHKDPIFRCEDICKNAAVRVFFAVTVEVQKLFLSASCTAYEFVGWLDELEIS